MISKSILGLDSNRLSYSLLHIFKKSLQGFRFNSCKDNSISILRLNLDHAKALILWFSYNSAYFKNANKVPKIPHAIFKVPTPALNPCCRCSGT